MVFFVVIPALYGAFGNFLLPTQLGVRDVAFPRLNSFMFWVTPSGFILLLHIFFFDKSTNIVFSNDIKSCNSKLKSLNSDSSSLYNTNNDKKKLTKTLESLSGRSYFNNVIVLQDNVKPKTNKTLLLDFKVNPNTLAELKRLTGGYVFSETNLGNNTSSVRELDYSRAVVVDKSTNNVNAVVSSYKLINVKVSSWVSNQLIPG
jgi:hypothetical protein